MDKFEAHVKPGGDIVIQLLDKGDIFLLDSEQGRMFAGELLTEIGKRYPTMIRAVEQKIKQENRSLFAVMKERSDVYTSRVAHIICSCCFGEDDEFPDYDGCRFNMEYPRQCRNAKFCPWNGYKERNKDSFMVICGAKREFGLSPQERRVLLNVQNGILSQEVMADIMRLSKASIWKFMTKIHEKTGAKTMPELVELVKEERI